MVFLDNEYTMDLFCNQTCLEIKRVKGPLRIQSNGVEISVNNKSKIRGYNKRVWLIRRYITNIIAMENLTEKYRVAYDRNYQMFIVQREGTDLPNM